MPRSPAVSPLLSCAHQYPYSFHTISRFFRPRLGAARRGSSTSDMSRTQFAFGAHIHTVLQSPRPPATSELSYRGLQDKLPCSGRRLDSPPWKNPCTLTTIDLRNQRNHQAARSKPSWVSCRSRPEAAVQFDATPRPPLCSL